MTWEELEAVDPADLLSMPPEFTNQFPPVEVDGTLTIGMAAYGNLQTTLFALRAILASVHGDFELILVDDASPDETGKLFELVPRVHGNTRIFRFSRNIEYSGSLNTILSHAQGNNILFVSNDIFVTPAYISQLLSVAGARPEAGIIRGCSNHVDNGLILHNIKDCGELDNFASLFSYSASRSDRYQLKCMEDPFLTGDAFMITREVLNRSGFIDPRFFGYFADHDLGVRARRSGYKPLLAMGAFAWHQHGSNIEYLAPAEKEKKIRARWARVNENWARFKAKYNLPISLPYLGMRRIPWDALCSSNEADDFSCPPCDNLKFQIPQKPHSIEGRCYRATELAKRARVYINASRVTDAIKLCREALNIDPENIDAMSALGTAFVYQGRLAEGIRTFRRVLKKSPTSAKAHSNLLLSMNYSDTCSQQAIYLESRKWEALHTQKSPDGTVVPAVTQRSRIRIAYLSPDFRSHSVSYFFSPLLRQHDREQFEIFCLSDALHTDSVTDRLMSLSDGWRDISHLDMDGVEMVIREIRPDILVDLAGHTGHTIRLPLFSKRLAPVQVTWLGYPNTTGIGEVDYRLTDLLADPADSPDTALYSENLHRLPGGFLCYEPPENAPDVASLPLIKNGHVTFGSFNMLPKMTDTVIAVWSEILKQNPGARLILKNHYFRDIDTARRVLRNFKRNGIVGERIDLLCSDVDLTTHLGQYGQIDIALDTFPYNGTTTTCEALWMGVPVVTMRGDRHSGRVGASILHAVGYDDCVADSIDGYVATSIKLSSCMAELEEKRSGLRGRMKRSTLNNATGFAQKMEVFYRGVFLKHHRV